MAVIVVFWDDIVSSILCGQYRTPTVCCSCLDVRAIAVVMVVQIWSRGRDETKIAICRRAARRLRLSRILETTQLQYSFRDMRRQKESRCTRWETQQIQYLVAGGSAAHQVRRGRRPDGPAPHTTSGRDPGKRLQTLHPGHAPLHTCTHADLEPLTGWQGEGGGAVARGGRRTVQHCSSETLCCPDSRGRLDCATATRRVGVQQITTLTSLASKHAESAHALAGLACSRPGSRRAGPPSSSVSAVRGLVACLPKVARFNRHARLCSRGCIANVRPDVMAHAICNRHTRDGRQETVAGRAWHCECWRRAWLRNRHGANCSLLMACMICHGPP